MDNLKETEEVTFDNFGFCGTSEGFFSMIDYLASIAEEEKWSFTERQNSILIKYIKGTFKQCYKQGKLLYSKDKTHVCFNTGLLTSNGNDILAIFEKNNKAGAQPWRLKSFRDRTERFYMEIFDEVPSLATYTDDYEKYYFNPHYEIIISTDHILDDNWERIHEVVPLSKSIVKSLMVGVIEETKKKIKRNLRLVVPQYYNNQIMYLMPLRIPIDDEKYVTMALAVELTSSNQYRANTIFTKETAYEKARLLMKPESNWLI